MNISDLDCIQSLSFRGIGCNLCVQIIDEVIVLDSLRLILQDLCHCIFNSDLSDVRSITDTKYLIANSLSRQKMVLQHVNKRSAKLHNKLPARHSWLEFSSHKAKGSYDIEAVVNKFFVVENFIKPADSFTTCCTFKRLENAFKTI